MKPLPVSMSSLESSLRTRQAFFTNIPSGEQSTVPAKSYADLLKPPHLKRKRPSHVTDGTDCHATPPSLISIVHLTLITMAVSPQSQAAATTQSNAQRAVLWHSQVIFRMAIATSNASPSDPSVTPPFTVRFLSRPLPPRQACYLAPIPPTNWPSIPRTPLRLY